MQFAHRNNAVQHKVEKASQEHVRQWENKIIQVAVLYQLNIDLSAVSVDVLVFSCCYAINVWNARRTTRSDARHFEQRCYDRDSAAWNTLSQSVWARAGSQPRTKWVTWTINAASACLSYFNNFWLLNGLGLTFAMSLLTFVFSCYGNAAGWWYFPLWPTIPTLQYCYSFQKRLLLSPTFFQRMI